MPKITYVAVDGARATVDVPVGVSVMQGAVSNDVEGILGECGGAAMCATCHVHLDGDDLDRAGDLGPDEDEMLDATACPRTPTSRLSCQIKVTEELDGLTVTLPEEQI